MVDETVLLVIDSGHLANPFGHYLGEILKTEGFIAHRQMEVSQVAPDHLRGFPLVVLAEVSLTDGQRETFRRYVAEGGRLLAMRPDPKLADLFGLALAGTRQERHLQYLATEASSEIARGIEPTPLQYHGEADEYRLVGASAVAWLCDDDMAPSAYPAANPQVCLRGLQEKDPSSGETVISIQLRSHVGRWETDFRFPAPCLRRHRS